MITVFGSINLDLVVAVPRLPRPGETVSGPDHQTFPGGKGANQALAARRAGADVRLIGAVGQDAFAELALANLQKTGVDLSGVRSLDGSTGLAFIAVDPEGENQILVARGTNARVQADWLKPVLGSRDTLMVQGEASFDQIGAAILLAREAGAAVCWNPAPVPEGDLSTCFEALSLLVVNETEALEIGRRHGLKGDADGFIERFAAPSRAVVVTLGAEGVVAGHGDQRLRLKAPRIKAVDTTGAGDAFCGALAAALDLGRPFERAVKEGIAAGALACTVTGAQSGAPEAGAIARLADQIV